MSTPKGYSVTRIVLIMVALHVLAVPFHRLVLKNDVMRQMLRPSA